MCLFVHVKIFTVLFQAPTRFNATHTYTQNMYLLPVIPNSIKRILLIKMVVGLYRANIIWKCVESRIIYKQITKPIHREVYIQS